MYGVSSQIDEKHKWLAELLPHGSGIDSDWNSWESENYVYFTNSYHAMNEVGFYEGYQDFSIRVDKSIFQPDNVETIARDFTLQFNGDRYLSVKHDLRDYLTDTIYHALTYDI